MTDSPTKLQRWLDLIAFLAAHRLPVSVEDLMEGVPAYAAKWQGGDETARATARRTFERDKDELRRAGIPIRTVPYGGQYGRENPQGYRLERRDFHLPFLRLVSREGGGEGEGARGGAPSAPSGAPDTFDLTPGEHDIAVRALRRVACLPAFPYAAETRSALRKLTFDLERGERSEEGEAGSPVLFLERSAGAEIGPLLEELSEALLQRKRVRFRYHGLYRDEETSRDVAPYGLLFLQGHWYLVGHDADREAVRVFRVGRMREVRRNTAKPHTPDYDVPADFRLDDHVGRRAWEFPSEGDADMEARVLFRFPASLAVEQAGHGRAIEEREDGGVVRAFEVRQMEPFVRWILSFEDEALVLEPPELRAAVWSVAAAVAAKHGHPDPGDDHG